MKSFIFEVYICVLIAFLPLMLIVHPEQFIDGGCEELPYGMTSFFWVEVIVWSMPSSGPAVGMIVVGLGGGLSILKPWSKIQKGATSGPMSVFTALKRGEIMELFWEFQKLILNKIK